MTKQQRLSGGWIVGLALALVVFLGALGFVQDAQAAQYNMSLRAPDEVLQYQNAELIATVTDSQGHPVNGIPVEFRAAPGWENNVTLAPQSITTQNGEARTVFRSDMTGMVNMTAQAGDATAMTHVTVSGTGSKRSGFGNEEPPPSREGSPRP